MNCEDCLLQLDSWIDSQPFDGNALIEEHLIGCPECNSEAERRKLLSEQLTYLVNQPAAEVPAAKLEAIAARVTQKLDRLPDGSPTLGVHRSIRYVPGEASNQTEALKRTAGSRGIWHFGQLLLGVAAGFLLAASIFQPWTQKTDGPLISPELSLSPTNTGTSDFGTLRVAMKPLQVQLHGQDEWTSIPPNSPIPMKCRLQTDGTLCCEIEQSNGSVFRIDRDSILTIEDGDQFRLDSGRIWVEGSEKLPVEIATSDLTITATGPCNAETSAGIVELISFDEPIQVEGTTWSETLAANSAAIFDKRGLRSCRSSGADGKGNVDLILASAWIHEFLTRSSSKRQFATRLESLCDGLQGDAADDCASELRKLGAPAADALVAWLSSQQKAQIPAEARRRASELIAATASYAQAELLIDLLDDGDPVVSRNVEQGLERITGHRASPIYLKARSPAKNHWLEWWKMESSSTPNKPPSEQQNLKSAKA